MTKKESVHIAQVFAWWVAGFGLIISGIWGVFTYVMPPTPAPTPPATPRPIPGPVEFTVEQIVQDVAWSTETKTKTIELTRSVESDPVYYEEKWSCGEDQKIVDVTYECNDPKAGFAYSVTNDGIAGRNYDADFSIVEKDKMAIVRRKITSFPMTCLYHVHYVEQRKPRKTLNQGTRYVRYNNAFDIEILENNVGESVILRGKDADGNSIVFDSTVTNSDSPIKVLSRKQADGKTTLTLILKFEN